MSSHLAIQNHNPATRRLKNSPLQNQNLYSAKLRLKSSPMASQGSLLQSQDQWALLRDDKITWLSSAKVKGLSLCNANITRLSLLPSKVHRPIICPAETIGNYLLNSPVLSHITRPSLQLFRLTIGSCKLKITWLSLSQGQFRRLFSAMSWGLFTGPSAKPECCTIMYTGRTGVTQVMWTHCLYVTGRNGSEMPR